MPRSRSRSRSLSSDGSRSRSRSPVVVTYEGDDAENDSGRQSPISAHAQLPAPVVVGTQQAPRSSHDSDSAGGRGAADVQPSHTSARNSSQDAQIVGPDGQVRFGWVEASAGTLERNYAEFQECNGGKTSPTVSRCRPQKKSIRGSPCSLYGSVQLGDRPYFAGFRCDFKATKGCMFLVAYRARFTSKNDYGVVMTPDGQLMAGILKPAKGDIEPVLPLQECDPAAWDHAQSLLAEVFVVIEKEHSDLLPPAAGSAGSAGVQSQGSRSSSRSSGGTGSPLAPAKETPQKTASRKPAKEPNRVPCKFSCGVTYAASSKRSLKEHESACSKAPVEEPSAKLQQKEDELKKLQLELLRSKERHEAELAAARARPGEGPSACIPVDALVYLKEGHALALAAQQNHNHLLGLAMSQLGQTPQGFQATTQSEPSEFTSVMLAVPARLRLSWKRFLGLDANDLLRLLKLMETSDLDYQHEMILKQLHREGR